MFRIGNILFPRFKPDRLIPASIDIGCALFPGCGWLPLTLLNFELQEVAMKIADNLHDSKSGLNILSILSAIFMMANASMAQKPWVSAENTGELKAVHPSLKFHDLMPDNFKFRIGAWDWYDANTIIFAHWDRNEGSVWLLEGVKTRDKTKVTYKKYYDQGIPEPLGIKRVNERVYVAHKHAITELTDANKDDVAESHKVLTTFEFSRWKQNPDRMHPNTFVYDLKYKDGYLYTGTGFTASGAGFQYPPLRSESAIFKVNAATGAKDFFATGLRSPDGLAWGPEGELWCTTNQGAWSPSSKLIHLKAGAFYGQQYQENGKEKETPPAVHIPFGSTSKSPTQPLLMSHGPYQGQFIIGDVFYGNIHRVYVEKVAGEYQGAHFNFSAGQSAGIHRILQDETGTLYLGGIGAKGGGGTWMWNGKEYGIQAVTYTEDPAFEVHSVNSLRDGFMLNFTEPVSSTSLTPDNFEVTHWHYVPTKAYGGPAQGVGKLKVTQVTADPSGKQIRLQIQGLTKGKVVGVRFHKDFVSATGKPPFTGEFRYTLNAISDRDEVVSLSDSHRRSVTGMRVVQNGPDFNIVFSQQVDGTLALADLNGKNVFVQDLSNQSDFKFAVPQVKTGIYILKFTSDIQNLSNPIFIGR